MLTIVTVNHLPPSWTVVRPISARVLTILVSFLIFLLFAKIHFHDEHFRWRVWSGQPMLTQIKLYHSCLLILVAYSLSSVLQIVAEANLLSLGLYSTPSVSATLRNPNRFTVISLDVRPISPTSPFPKHISSIMMILTYKWQAYVQAFGHWRECLCWTCFLHFVFWSFHLFGNFADQFK